LARRLLQELYNFIASKGKIKVVTLHVVGYNKRAIAFYKKSGYRLLESIGDHYHIMGKEYQGLKLGMFVNGGQERQGWIRWFRKIFGKNNG
jgi:ribosomal protein S18 acetylase RimI-like enzyme